VDGKMLKIVATAAVAALSMSAPLAHIAYGPHAQGAETSMQVLDDPGTAADESRGKDFCDPNANAPLGDSAFGDKGKDWVKGDSDTLAKGPFLDRR
jgi:hypothetical protein